MGALKDEFYETVSNTLAQRASIPSFFWKSNATFRKQEEVVFAPKFFGICLNVS